MADALTKLGEAARRARAAISPWNVLSPTDIAGALPGGGIPSAAAPYGEGLRKTAEATKAFREGRYGDAARWYGSGVLDTGTAALSALPEGGALTKLAMAVAPAVKAVAGSADEVADGAGAMRKMAGIKAFHGSPHDFDRFSMDKIGTGEGAQAYGHGLYFAENEGVAKGYRSRLAGPASVAVDGSTQQPFADLADATKRFIADNPSAHPVMDRTRQDIGSSVAKWLGEEAGGGQSATQLIEKLVADYPDDVRPQVQQWADEIVGHLRPMMKVEQPGRMYEVRINADPEQFLDWDKPLSEQPQSVQDALKGLGVPLTPRGADEFFNISQSLPRAPDAKSRTLNEAGIPGIKYLDAVSRAAGGGSSNYVVFDDALVEIVRKYGWAPGMAIPAAMALEIQQAQEQSAPQM